MSERVSPIGSEVNLPIHSSKLQPESNRVSKDQFQDPPDTEKRALNSNLHKKEKPLLPPIKHNNHLIPIESNNNPQKRSL